MISYILRFGADLSADMSQIVCCLYSYSEIDQNKHTQSRQCMTFAEYPTRCQTKELSDFPKPASLFVQTQAGQAWDAIYKTLYES